MLSRYFRFAVVLVAMMLAAPMVVGILSSDREAMPFADRFEGGGARAHAGIPERVVDWLSLPQRSDAYLSDHFGLRS